MTIEKLNAAKIVAMKNKDSVTKEIISNMIDACQKAAITPKGRLELTEQLVDEALIKYQKTIQEMVDGCPANRPDLMAAYTVEMEIVKQYAPHLMTNPEEIRTKIVEILTSENIEQNRGKIMKAITPYFKGKADMKIVSQVVAEMVK